MSSTEQRRTDNVKQHETQRTTETYKSWSRIFASWKKYISAEKMGQRQSTGTLTPSAVAGAASDGPYIQRRMAIS